MSITNASRIADFGSGIGTAGAVIQIDNANQRVGIGTTNPLTTLQVAGIVSATSFTGNLTGTASTATEAGTAYGLTGSPNITVGTVTGSLTGTASTATAAGTAYGLTGSPNITVGVVTATSFVGSASSLTGITGKAAAMAIVFGG
jgi:hypothetical protein